MPWKKDTVGQLAVDAAGNPVWIKEDNSEQPIPSISALNNEARTNRERAEAAELKLADYKGIDPAKAREALQTVKDIDTSKLIDQGKLEEAKQAVAAQFQATIAERDASIADLKTKHQNAMIDSAFAGSGFMKDKVAVPAGMFMDTFRKHFTTDDKGQLTAKDANGNVIYSTNGSGGPAGVDEALAKLVDLHPDRNSILRAPNHSGTGNNGKAGDTNVNARRIARADFDKMPPMDQAAMAGQIAKREVVIQD